ncbi:MAG TPA: porin [Bacteroidales bacterium]|nr:porin [Bacteroidales bacterium]
MATNRALKIIFLVLIGSTLRGYGQIDPLWTRDTAFVKQLYVLTNKFHSLSLTGYLQVQYQHADSSGIRTFNGGDFAPASDNRFMIRRGRFRLDYSGQTKDGDNRYSFALQFDGTERGVNIRDMFGRIYDTRWHLLAATVGMFNRPFGNELIVSSSMRESPERGRMSQILMKNERDLGVMLSFDPQDKHHKLYRLRLDAGFFNGQGLAGLAEFDSYKDFIARASVRELPITRNLRLSGGVSYLNGGIVNEKAEKSPRIYYGTDLQLSFTNPLGKTELRGEYVTGIQSATFASSATPGILPMDKNNVPVPIIARNFDGAYLYLLHTVRQKHQFFVKYDWYDPNTRVKGADILSGGEFGEADILFSTYGIGYANYLNENMKIVLYYDHPVNEMTGISGFTGDYKDNTYTVRIQYRF